MDTIVDECKGVAILQESELNSLIKIWSTLMEKQFTRPLAKAECENAALQTVKIYGIFKQVLKSDE